MEGLMVYMISYEFHGFEPEADKGLVDALKKYKNRLHALGSMWFVDTPDSLDDIYSDLKGHIGKDDKLYVVRLESSNDGIEFLHKNACHTTWLSSPKRAWN